VRARLRSRRRWCSSPRSSRAGRLPRSASSPRAMPSSARRSTQVNEAIWYGLPARRIDMPYPQTHPLLPGGAASDAEERRRREHFEDADDLALAHRFPRHAARRDRQALAERGALFSIRPPRRWSGRRAGHLATLVARGELAVRVQVEEPARRRLRAWAAARSSGEMSLLTESAHRDRGWRSRGGPRGGLDREAFSRVFAQNVPRRRGLRG